MTATPAGMERESAQANGAARRKGPMEQVIEALGSGLGNSVGWLAESGILFALFAIVWVAFGAALIWSQGSLDQAWQAIRDLPLLPRSSCGCSSSR